MPARIVAALALLLSPSLAPPAHAEQIVMRPPPITVTVRRGVTIKYLALTKPNTTPAVAVMLFAGGNGLLNLQPNGAIGSNLAGNFLVRSRARFVQRDLFVAVVDTPNQVAIDGNVRLSAQYAQDIGRVIADVRGVSTRAARSGWSEPARERCRRRAWRPICGNRGASRAAAAVIDIRTGSS